MSACLLAVASCFLTPPVGAYADAVTPSSAAAFRESVGVQTHIVYYDTSYANWSTAVDRLVALGVTHVRDGVYGNPAARWRDWNEAYYRAVELAATRGIRFDVGMGRPGSETGTLDELLDVVQGRLRNAVDALEGPNEFDYFVGGPTWPTRLSAYVRNIYRKAK